MKRGVDYTGVSVVTICHDGAGKYLFGKRSDKCRDEHSRWDLMGSGGVEFGEKLEDAVRRETAEEVGTVPIKIEMLGYREVLRETEEGKTHYIAFDFKVEVKPDEVKNMEPEKCLELGWFTLDKLPDPMHSQWSKFYEQYKDRL